MLTTPSALLTESEKSWAATEINNLVLACGGQCWWDPMGLAGGASWQRRLLYLVMGGKSQRPFPELRSHGQHPTPLRLSANADNHFPGSRARWWPWPRPGEHRSPRGPSGARWGTCCPPTQPWCTPRCSAKIWLLLQDEHSRDCCVVPGCCCPSAGLSKGSSAGNLLELDSRLFLGCAACLRYRVSRERTHPARETPAGFLHRLCLDFSLYILLFCMLALLAQWLCL